MSQGQWAEAITVWIRKAYCKCLEKSVLDFRWCGVVRIFGLNIATSIVVGEVFWERKNWSYKLFESIKDATKLEKPEAI